MFGDFSFLRRAALLGAAALALRSESGFRISPVSQAGHQMKADGMSDLAIFVIFKESKLEIWKQRGTSKYALPRPTTSASGPACSVRRSRKAIARRPRASTP
jgi:hypothetical protein